MTPTPLRIKLVAAAVALAMAGGVVLYSLGTANAAEWHAYTGDVYAGHAYGVEVPADAQGLEVKYEGNGTATFALFDPFGAKLGYYSLDSGLPAADLASPQMGTYVLYVYGLKDGALHLAVNSAKSPSPTLEQLGLQREDVTIASFDQPAPLDKAMTATFKAAPLFVTLLYDGSVEHLNAEVASGKGDVLAIADESGTAFAPGVFGDQSGTRAADFANLEGSAYTATAHAKSFQGTMVLTALSLAPKPVETVPAPAPNATPVPAPDNASAPVTTPASAPVTLAEGKAFAFSAQPGPLTLSDAKKGNGSYVFDHVLVYTPEDKLLGEATLSSSDPVAKLALPVAGEYVAYVERASGLAVVAQVPGGDGTARELALGHEERAFNASALDPTGSQSVPFSLEHAPVAVSLDGTDSLSLLGGADVRNDKGLVASWESIAQVPGVDALSSSDATPQHFAAGPHVFEAWQFTEGSLVLKTTYYLRDAPAQVAPPAPAPAPAPENGTTNGTADNGTTWDPTQPLGPLPLDAPLLGLPVPWLVAPRLI